MPIYLFDCHHLSCAEECIGHELPGHEEAQRLAIQFAGEILQHEAQALVDGHDLNVTVSDERHLVLFNVYATSMKSAAVAGKR